METLPDYLQPGLDIVLVGLNPSIPSAQTGHYFANPRNRFWPAFNGAEMTPEPLTAETDYRVLEFGIGMTDIVKRPTPANPLLHVEAEVHDIALPDDVFLAFESQATCLFGALLTVAGDEVVVSDHFGTDKAFLEIRVNFTSRLRRRRTDFGRPCANFFDARREVSL